MFETLSGSLEMIESCWKMMQNVAEVVQSPRDRRTFFGRRYRVSISSIAVDLILQAMRRMVECANGALNVVEGVMLMSVSALSAAGELMEMVYIFLNKYHRLLAYCVLAGTVAFGVNRYRIKDEDLYDEAVEEEKEIKLKEWYKNKIAKKNAELELSSS